jgi:transposase InsO family protein
MEYSRPEYKAGKRIKILALCQGLDISIRTLFRWRAAYIKNGFVGLTYTKAVGKKAVELTALEKFLISEMREKFRWGAEVMQAHLKYDHSVELSKYRIERYLTRSGLREEYPCTTKKIRYKQKREHKKVVKIYHPGEHTQMDTKHQPHILKNGEKCYVFNFIDHASNWSYKRAYSKICPKSTIDFMERLLKVCPFKINRLQTDNGTEYTYKFYKRYVDIKKDHPLENFCEKFNIVQKLIPPGVKELQGLVERSHRQDDQELFSRIEPDEIDEFNSYLEEFYQERNKGRRFKKLDWRAPEEWLIEYRNMQNAVEHGHLYKFRKREEDLLPFLKNDELPKSNEQVSLVKSEKSLNNCKDKKETVDKKDIKQAA